MENGVLESVGGKEQKTSTTVIVGLNKCRLRKFEKYA